MKPICPFSQCKREFLNNTSIREHFQKAHQSERFTDKFTVSKEHTRKTCRRFSVINDQIVYVETTGWLSKYLITLTFLTQCDQHFPCTVKITSENGKLLLYEATRVCTYQQYQDYGNLSKFAVIFNILDNENFNVEIKQTVKTFSNSRVQPIGNSSRDEPNVMYPKLGELSKFKSQSKNESSTWSTSSDVLYKLTTPHHWIQCFKFNNQTFNLCIQSSVNEVKFEINSTMPGSDQVEIKLSCLDLNKEGEMNTFEYGTLGPERRLSLPMGFLRKLAKDDIVIFKISIA